MVTFTLLLLIWPLIFTDRRTQSRCSTSANDPKITTAYGVTQLGLGTILRITIRTMHEEWAHDLALGTDERRTRATIGPGGSAGGRIPLGDWLVGIKCGWGTIVSSITVYVEEMNVYSNTSPARNHHAAVYLTVPL